MKPTEILLGAAPSLTCETGTRMGSGVQGVTHFLHMLFATSELLSALLLESPNSRPEPGLCRGPAISWNRKETYVYSVYLFLSTFFAMYTYVYIDMFCYFRFIVSLKCFFFSFLVVALPCFLLCLVSL